MVKDLTVGFYKYREVIVHPHTTNCWYLENKVVVVVVVVVVVGKSVIRTTIGVSSLTLYGVYTFPEECPLFSPDIPAAASVS